jgi:hypothetical protein
VYAKQKYSRPYAAGKKKPIYARNTVENANITWTLCRDAYTGKRQKNQKKTTTKKKKNKTAQRRTLSGSAVAPNHYMNYK